MTSIAASHVSLQAGNALVPVSRFGAEAVILARRLDVEAALLKRFAVNIANGARRLQVWFAGEVSADGSQVVIAPEDRAHVQSAAAVVAGFSADRLRALIRPQPINVVARRHWPMAQSLALATVLLLGGYVGVRFMDKVTTIQPRFAYLATEATTLLSPTSGRVTYMRAPGAVQAGEPAVGVETTSGKNLLIDAPGNVDIVTAEKSPGDRVKRGDPLLVYAEPDAPAYLHAVVDREQAFRISDGVEVRYSRPDQPGDAVAFSVAANELHVRLLPGSASEALYDVRVPVEPGAEQFRAMPVEVKFKQSPVTAALQALRGFGVPSTELPAAAGDQS